jgi:aldose 1-epimerase
MHAGDARLVYAPDRGGRIVSLSVEGLDLLVSPDADERNFGMFVMAPFAGRVRDGRFSFDGEEYQLPLNKPPHAIHGTARDQTWTEEDEGVLSTELGPPWPLGGRVVHRIALSADALALTLEVHAADRPMPASCGWHPWWSRHAGAGQPLELSLAASAMYRRDDAGIPTGDLVAIPPEPWDDCFTGLGDPAATLTWPDAETVELRTNCSCLVVFTEPANARCVEPQTHPPDALNLGAARVEPGSPLIATSTWRWNAR